MNSNGTIYIGVKDNGKVIGLDDVDFVMQQLASSTGNSIRPDVSMFTSIELVQEAEKSLVKVTVSQGTKKPYYLYEKGLIRKIGNGRQTRYVLKF